MPILNYTTRIASSKTLGEMQEMLAKAGAQRIAVDYEDGGPSGLTFALSTIQGVRLFSLPVDVAAMHKVLLREGQAGRLGSLARTVWSSQEHAEKVAWRVTKDWLAAQLTLIATEMVTVDQVLLPYLRVNEHETLYDQFATRQLEAGSSF